ncbi:hypothetical protein GCM10010308_14610 [Streptomyces vinaceusdrappus]|nr:hypothetical protein GCM10010301_18900 [Streptomyces plicatus]GHC03209.1 hypothetical protein GCM10010308_14610 [Streptomyces vinaceusdrappus]
MASVLGMLEERETAARVRVEGLREEVARLAGVLEARARVVPRVCLACSVWGKPVTTYHFSALALIAFGLDLIRP